MLNHKRMITDTYLMYVLQALVFQYDCFECFQSENRKYHLYEREPIVFGYECMHDMCAVCVCARRKFEPFLKHMKIVGSLNETERLGDK